MRLSAGLPCSTRNVEGLQMPFSFLTFDSDNVHHLLLVAHCVWSFPQCSPYSLSIFHIVKHQYVPSVSSIRQTSAKAESEVSWIGVIILAHSIVLPFWCCCRLSVEYFVMGMVFYYILDTWKNMWFLLLPVVFLLRGISPSQITCAQAVSLLAEH